MESDVDFDRLVGQVAGAICGDLAACSPQPVLLLVPAVTFKVRRTLGEFTNVATLTRDQKGALADDLTMGIVQLLFGFEFETADIERMKPVIERAAFKALCDINPEVQREDHGTPGGGA